MQQLAARWICQADPDCTTDPEYDPWMPHRGFSSFPLPGSATPEEREGFELNPTQMFFDMGSSPLPAVTNGLIADQVDYSPIG